MQIEYTGEREGKQIVKVPITKASTKGEASYVEICWDDLPDDVAKEVVLQGLKTLMNRGMSKITDAKKDVKAREAAMEVAAKNAENLYAGQIRMSAGVRTKITGAVKTEAMRLARALIKEALKASGKKVSLIPAKVISQYAEALLQDETHGAECWAKAKATIEAREKEKDGSLADLKGFTADIKEDAVLVQKAAKAAASKRKPKAEAPAGVVAGKGQAQHQGAKH